MFRWCFADFGNSQRCTFTTKIHARCQRFSRTVCRINNDDIFKTGAARIIKCEHPMPLPTGAIANWRDTRINDRFNICHRFCIRRAFCHLRIQDKAPTIFRQPCVTFVGIPEFDVPIACGNVSIKRGHRIIFSVPIRRSHNARRNSTPIALEPRCRMIFLAQPYRDNNFPASATTAASLRSAKLPYLIICTRCTFPRQRNTVRIGCRSQVQVVVNHLDAVQVVGCIDSQQINQRIAFVTRNPKEIAHAASPAAIDVQPILIAEIRKQLAATIDLVNFKTLICCTSCRIQRSFLVICNVAIAIAIQPETAVAAIRAEIVNIFKSISYFYTPSLCCSYTSSGAF